MRKYLLLPVFILLALQMDAEGGCRDCGMLGFKENKGQWDKCALFASQLQSGTVFLSRDSFTFLFADTNDMNRIRHTHHPWMYNPHLDLGVRIHVFRQVFENTNADCKISGASMWPDYFNFYLGKDPSRWASGVRAFYNVNYGNLYDNIDLQVASQDVNMKYNFIVKPGGDPSVIRMKYVGTYGLQLRNDGDLAIKTSIGDITDMQPYAYQEINGERHNVNCSFILADSTVTFKFPDGYDKDAALVIDPTLIFSTYSGSDADNFGYSATYDSKGNAYAAGSVFQYVGSYPVTPGAFQTSWAGGVGFGDVGYYDGTGTDVAVTKYDSLGHTRIYSTYLGGDHDELPHSLIVNSNDELFVLGSTASDNFPVTHNAFDTVFKGGTDMGVFNGIGVHYATGSDIFITRFNSTGTALLASTYIGGSGNDGLTYPEYEGLNYNYADDVRGEINIDKNDNIYVASTTRSKDFPVTPGAFQTVLADSAADSSDAVVFKMDDNLSHMIWSTYLGGSDNDAAYSIDFDPNGDLYVGGGTISTDFPATQGVVQVHNAGGRADGFIVHLSKNGNAVLQSTYLGSSEYDQVYFVRTDKFGNAYGYGQTEAQDSTFIHNAAYNKFKGGQFIIKLTPHLDTIVWSTTFGSGRGTPDISPTAFLVDFCNKTYISGWGSDFFADYGIVGAPPLSTGGLDVTPNAIQLTTDSNDFYIMVMENDASALSYATYFGSPTDEEHVDGGTSRFDRKGVIYESVCAGCAKPCNGCTGQSTFPTTPGAVSRTNNSRNCNNAVFKIDFNLPLVLAAFTNPPTGCTPDTVSFNNQSQIYLNPSYQWSFGDGSTSTAANPTHVYTHSGVYTVELVVSDPGSCNYTDTAWHQITVISNSSTDTIPTIGICRGQQGQIGITPSYDTAIRYHWIPGTYLTQVNIANPFANPPQTTTYRLLVYNGICLDTFTQTVVVENNTLTVQGYSLFCQDSTTILRALDSDTSTGFTFSWQPVSEVVSGANSATPMVKPTQSTTFDVVVTSPLGCVYTDSIHITTSAALNSVAAFKAPPAVCIPDTAVFINQSVTYSAPTYSWNFGDGSTSNAVNPIHIYTQQGVYAVQLIVSDPASCNGKDTVNELVLALANTSTDTIPAVSVCLGQSVQIGVAAGNDSSLTFQWSPASYLNHTNIATPTATPPAATAYQLIIGNGACSDTLHQMVLVDTNSLKILPVTLGCSYDTARLTAVNSEPTQVFSYVWGPAPAIVSGDSSASPLIKPSQTTTYVVTATNQLGCAYTDSAVVTISSVIGTVKAFARPDTILYGDTTQLSLSESNINGYINWLPDSSIIGPLTISNPQADPRQTNSYVVLLHDAGGCKKYDTVIVYVVHTPCSETNIYVPDAFTPNGDGKNDVLYVRATSVTNIYFAVYDRWGQKMFETTDLTKGWDGTYKGKKMDAAVFGFYVKGVCANGENFEKKGNVTLLR